MNKRNSRVSDDEDDYLPTGNFLGYFEERETSRIITVPMDEDFIQPSYYRNVVNKLAYLTERDTVIFRLTSEGGYYDGLVTLLVAIADTEATVIANVVGRCHSAASFLALSCPNIRVSPYAEMMIHFIRFGTGGKAADLQVHVNHAVAEATRVFKQTYKYFLTEEEIQSCLEGKEIWMDSTEIKRRLEVRQDKQMKELKAKEKAEKPKAKISKVIPKPEYNPEDVAFSKED